MCAVLSMNDTGRQLLGDILGTKTQSMLSIAFFLLLCTFFPCKIIQCLSYCTYNSGDIEGHSSFRVLWN